LAQTNPAFKKKTLLKYPDANFSPVSLDLLFVRLSLTIMTSQDEKRSRHEKYYFRPTDVGNVLTSSAPVEESRGKKRARAEDFL
jgi:hypothetical protein